MERFNLSLDPARRGILLIMAAAAFWGTSGVATKTLYAITDTTPFSISAFRLLIAAPLLLLLCWRILGKRMFAITRRDLLVIMSMGMQIALSHASYFAAISYAGVAIATLVTICTAPILVAAVSTAVTREKLSRTVIIAMACALIGTALLVNVSPDAEKSATLPLGIGCALLAAVLYAGFILSGRMILGDYHPLQTTAIGLFAGSLLMGAIATGTGFVVSYPLEGWLLFLYLGVVPTALAYILFFIGVRSTPATVVSILVMVEPLTATALAWVIFGEQLGAGGVLGAILLLGAMIMLTKTQSK